MREPNDPTPQPAPRPITPQAGLADIALALNAVATRLGGIAGHLHTLEGDKQRAFLIDIAAAARAVADACHAFAWTLDEMTRKEGLK